MALQRAEVAAFTAIRDQLLLEKDKKTNLPNITALAKKTIEAAIKNPNSRAASIVAPAIGFSPDLLKKLDEEIEKTQARDKDFLRYRIHKQFFDKQREVLYDDPIKRKCLVTGRRAGKTELAAGSFCQTATIDKSPMLYVNLNFKNALKQMWEPIHKVSEKAGLLISRSSSSEGIIEWSNGSSLMFGGNSNSEDQNKYRGYKFRKVIIDECGAQRWLRSLVDEIITPTLLDFEDSTLCLQGTPSRVPKTFFESMWFSGAYKKYHWTGIDNPHIFNFMEVVNDFAKGRGLSLDSPFIQREYFGVMGAYDVEAMVYKTRKYLAENDSQEIVPPPYKITDIAIGVDYGFSDYNAVMGLAYNRDIRQGYFFFERKFNQSTVTEMIDTVRLAVKEAEALAFKHGMDRGNIEVVADPSDQQITFELATTYNLPARNAYRYNKEMAIFQFADCLRAGQITMKEGGHLDLEMETLIFARDEEDNILPIIDDAVGGHPDAADAALYAFRQFAFNTGLEVDNVPESV